MKKARITFFLLAFLAIPLQQLLAQVMEGTLYKIQSDSLNFGGGNSSSTSYGLEDTVGEMATGESDSATYSMRAGYQQMQETYIAITSPSDLTLASISGIIGGGSEGTVSWTVTTDNTAGYTMTAHASTNPAFQAATDSFADYTPAGSDPDYTFAVDSSASEFGFTPEGSHINARFKDNGTACNTGSGDTSGKCWDGLSTTPQTIAGSTSSNQPSGTSTTMRVRAEIGSSDIQTADTYSATITVTATTL